MTAAGYEGSCFIFGSSQHDGKTSSLAPSVLSTCLVSELKYIYLRVIPSRFWLRLLANICGAKGLQLLPRERHVCAPYVCGSLACSAERHTLKH